jgi:hypothetical protein
MESPLHQDSLKQGLQGTAAADLIDQHGDGQQQHDRNQR